MAFDIDEFLKKARSGLEDMNAGKGVDPNAVTSSPNPEPSAAQATAPGDDELGSLIEAIKTQGPANPEAQGAAKPFVETTLPQTDEPAPVYANGTTPDRALAQSPLDAVERAKFSLFGNKKGLEAELKKRFQEVRIDPNNKDSYVVKDSDGIWKAVDPDNGAWETTKNLLAALGKGLVPGAGAKAAVGADELSTGEREAVGDVADVSRELGIVGGSITAAALTGGTSLAVQAGAQVTAAGASRAIQTSLGRAIGTYDATASEQLQDVGTEMLLAMGGEVIGAGVRAGAKTAIKAVEGIAKNSSRWSQGTRTMVADVSSKLLGVNGRALDEALDPANSKRIQSLIARATQGAGNSMDDVAFKLQRDQLDLTRRTMELMETGIEDVWNLGMKEAADSVSNKSFSVNAQELLKPMREFALENNLLKVQERVVTAQGKTIIRDVAADKLQQVLAKRNGALPSSWVVKPVAYDDALKAFQNKGQQIPELFMDSQQGIKELQSFLMQAEKVAGASRKLEGAQGFEQLGTLLKNFKRSTYSFRQRAQKDGLNAAANAAANIANRLDEAMETTLKSRGLDDALTKFTETKRTYATARQQTQTFLDMWDQYKQSKDLNILGKLGDDLLKGAGRKQQQTAGMDYVLTQLFKGRNSQAQGRARAVYQDLLLHDAALQFVPMVGKGRGSLAATAAIGSLGAGNLKQAAGFAVSAGISSPRMGFKAIRAYQDLVQAPAARKAKEAAMQRSLGQVPAKSLAKYGLETVNFMRNLGGNGMRAVAQDEKMVRSVLQTMIRSTGQEEQASQELLDRATQLPPGVEPEDLI